MTPLHFAAVHRNIKIAQLLITAGADQTYTTSPEAGWKTPLDAAKIHKDMDMIKLLLSCFTYEHNSAH